MEKLKLKEENKSDESSEETKQETSNDALPSPEFNPAEELQKIKKLPHDEKKTALEVYKDKLFQQKDMLTGIEQELISAFLKNPGMSEAELSELFKSSSAYKELSSVQKEIIGDAIHEVIERHKFISDLRAQFPIDTDLFFHLFGFHPVGNIEIRLDALNLKVIMDEIKDSATITEGAFLKKRMATGREIGEGKSTGGKALTMTLVPGPDHVVIVLNHSKRTKKLMEEAPADFFSYESMVAHEEQHIINNLFKTKRLERYFKDKAFEIDTENLNPKEKLIYFIKMYRKYFPEWQYKDEALAFYKMGAPLDQIKTIVFDLEDGSYPISDYEWFFKELMREKLPEEEWGQYFEEEFERLFVSEMKDIVSNAADAMNMLEKRGLSREEIILLLSNEPLVSWKKFAVRYLETHRP